MSDPQDEIEQEDFATLFAREERAAGAAGRTGRHGTDPPDRRRDRLRRRRRQGRGADRPGRAGGRRGQPARSRWATRSRPPSSARGDDIRLSYRLLQGAQARQGLAVAAETGLPVEGKVAGVIKGGYEVTVAGLRAFCPFSQMDLRRVDDAEALRRARARVPHRALTENGRNIVLSRRVLLEEQAARGRRGNTQEAPRPARCFRAPSPRSPTSAPSWTSAGCRA